MIESQNLNYQENSGLGIYTPFTGAENISPEVPIQNITSGIQNFETENLYTGMDNIIPGSQVVTTTLPFQSAISQTNTPSYLRPKGSRCPIPQNYVSLGVPGADNNPEDNTNEKISTPQFTTSIPPAVPGVYSGVVNTLVPTIVLGVIPNSAPGGASSIVGMVPGVAYIPQSGLVATINGQNTVISPHSYTTHVEMMRNAFQDINTDEDAIIRIIHNTSNIERALIRRLYYKKYNEDLIHRLQNELDGDFKDAVIGSFMTPTEYDAYCLNMAMKGIGTKEGVLTEIIGSRTSKELLPIKQIYSSSYREDLQTAVEHETSGDYQKLLLALLKCQRSDLSQPDINRCIADASSLYKAGEGKLGTDEDTFTRIFTTRSPIELEIINKYYKQQSGKGLLGAINSEFSGDTKELLNTIVRSNVDPYGYYARRIGESLSGFGTNDSRLTRNICARHSVDMPYIRQAYLRDFGRDMLRDIQKDTSGSYRSVLTSLVSNAR